MTKHHVQLSPSDREYLQQLVQQDNVGVKVYRRARALLHLDQGATLQSAAALVEVTSLQVSKWRDRYRQEGLALLQDKPRSGRPPRIDGTQRAKITALACSTPPEGYARWSLRLLASKVVELGYVDQISHDRVHQILKKTNSSRTSKRRGA
jgi:transposase